ncbi:MAG: histidine ammonia-lyase [Clostridia bacterium]|nr:histidine ammonia-lyase [Clostridia bacterium]
MKITVNGNLTLADVVNVARNGYKVEISAEAYQRMAVSRALVDDCVKEARVVYGITTGFGKFSDVSIAEADSKKLQKNLIMSHSCGVGEPLKPENVRAMMLLRINSLSVGNSGISRNTIDALLALLNSEVVPYVPSKGSLGASGDLVPLAHMTLTLLGMGDAFYKGKKMPAKKALALAGLSPIELTAKEGLALINGTQAMNSFATLNVVDAERLNKIADICSALTMEAQRAVTDPFDPRIHELRRQSGQIDTAKNLLTLLNGSERTTKQGEIRVQDAYTIRCVPQIHGPSKDALGYVKGIVEREINAVTDNPVIFPETDQAISGGNFHGQCLAMALDFLAISLSELANVSERRIERLVNPQLSGLPAFLVKKGGLNSGFMIPQYVAASLVNENKVLSHPACVDSITSSANQEDHVSMGMTAARKSKTIVENVTNVLAIELLVACQAIDFGDKNLKLGKGTAAAYETVRNEVTFMNKDRFIAPDIAKCAELIVNGDVMNAVEKAAGKLL